MAEGGMSVVIEVLDDVGGWVDEGELREQLRRRGKSASPAELERLIADGQIAFINGSYTAVDQAGPCATPSCSHRAQRDSRLCITCAAQVAAIKKDEQKNHPTGGGHGSSIKPRPTGGTMPAFKPKECAGCGETFQPKSGASKYCADCKSDPLKRAKPAKPKLPKPETSPKSQGGGNANGSMSSIDALVEDAREFAAGAERRVRYIEELAKLMAVEQPSEDLVNEVEALVVEHA